MGPPVFYELFAGTHSLSKIAKARGWECVTVDMDAKFGATVTCNVMDLPLDFCKGATYVHASPPCTPGGRALPGDRP